MPIEYAAEKIPPGMKQMIFCNSIFEEPQLLVDILENLAVLTEPAIDMASAHPSGVDVDLLARGSTEAVRARTRQILEACAPAGSIMLGSGNSVTNYCEIENYYALIDETRKWNEEHGYD